MKNSYIIYTNNSGKYIEKVLRRILNKMEDDEQLVIVDDLSTDNTIPLVVGLVGYNWEDEDHYKLYINIKPKGRNKSLEMAKSIADNKYFKFVVNKKK